MEFDPGTFERIANTTPFDFNPDPRYKPVRYASVEPLQHRADVCRLLLGTDIRPNGQMPVWTMACYRQLECSMGQLIAR